MNVRLSFQLSEDQQALMACIDTFEQSAVDTHGDLRHYLSHVPQDLQITALKELVRVDFERRWARGEKRRIPQYLGEYPELKTPASASELLQAEYSFRLRDGEQPSVDEYRAIEPSFMPPVDTGDIVLSETQPFTQSPTVDQDAKAKTLGGADLAAGRIASRYVIKQELGSGGFGVVYHAYDELLERDVAIKLRRGTQENPGLSQDQLHEAQSAGKLDHPGIAKVFDAGQSSDGQGFVVYQYVEGKTLAAKIERGGYTPQEAAEWVARVAEALHHAHPQHIVHRDIKPANILIDGEGQPKIVDFGLARRDNKFYADERGHLMGTAAYMSPEQANRDPQWANPQSDLYSLGVVLYELLCRELPFKSTKRDPLLDEIRRQAPAAPRSIDPRIPLALEAVCLKAMSKDPAKRFSNGADMAAALRAAVRPSSASASPLWVRLVRYAASAAALAAFVVLVVWLTSSAVVPVSAPTLASVKSIGIFLDGDSVLTLRRPLTDKDSLEVQAAFDGPAYGYLLKFEQDGKGELLWPARESLSSHAQRTDTLGSRRVEVTFPNADGAVMLAALASPKRLTEAQIDALLETPFDLGVSREDAAREKPYCWVVEVDSPKIDTSPPIKRGEGVAAQQSERRDRLAVAPEFKQKLREIGGPLGGMILSHKKADSETQE